MGNLDIKVQARSAVPHTLRLVSGASVLNLLSGDQSTSICATPAKGRTFKPDPEGEEHLAK